MTRTLICLCAGVGLALSGGGAAMAGEVGGTGEEVHAPDHARSECAFSGLDTADAEEGNPPGFDDDMIAERGNQSPAGKDRYHGVQSYGAIVSVAGKDALPITPGDACRGNLEMPEEP